MLFRLMSAPGIGLRFTCFDRQRTFICKGQFVLFSNSSEKNNTESEVHGYNIGFEFKIFCTC